MQESTEGVYSGIGAMLSQNRNTGLCTIVRVFENSPAFEAGMKPGDILYKVEDKVVANESLTILQEQLHQGPGGKPGPITVYRQGRTGVEMTTRRSIEVPTVEHIRCWRIRSATLTITQFDLGHHPAVQGCAGRSESQG